MNSRTKIELMRIPSIEQAKLRPLLDESVQMRATYKHIRSTDYATSKRLYSKVEAGGSYLTTKSCDNIYARQLKSCAGDEAFVWRDTTRSEEQLCPQPPVPTSARSRLSALLKKLSPRPLRSKSQPIPIISPPNQLSPTTQRANERKASQSSIHDTTVIIAAPQIVVAPVVIDRSKRLYEPNRGAKLRSNRCYSGKSDRLKTACPRPHTLHLPPGGAAGRELQRRMASYESIGSCSLDVDITNSTSELLGSGSVSEQTLHSLELSANEPTTPEYVKRVAKLFEPVEAGPSLVEVQVNGESTKKPSYLGLACSISGYTTITNYDSKLRDGFRSRDHSPGRFIRSRDVSPFKCGQDQADCAALRCSGNFLALPKYYEESSRRSGSEESRQSLNGGHKSGITACERSGPVNGSSAIDRTLNSEQGKMADRGTLRESSRTFMSTMLTTNTLSDFESQHRINGAQNGNAQGGVLQNGGAHNGGIQNGGAHSGGIQNGGAQNGAILNGGAQKRSPGSVRVVEFTSQTKSYVQNGAFTFSETTKQFSQTKSQFLESRVSSEVKSQGFANRSDGSSKSFIQQRVERLYGPGALAQGFFRRAAGPTGQARDQVPTRDESPLVTSATSTTSAGLPVLRHLRPEFRAQLALGTSARRPTALQTQVSVESVSDVLPAAPEVVLPIDQPTASTSEVEVRPEVKDGAYFLLVLKDEIDIINGMVAKTEQDLEEADGDLDEEVSGKLRTVIGQARLLVKQKLQQFEGLCHKNMSQSSEEPFPTTADDLAGFWDMVKLQVNQVHAMFADLDRLKANGWRELPTTPTSGPKRRSTKQQRPVKAEANSDARKAREEARKKMMEEKRRQMREKAKQGADGTVEIYVPEEGGN